MLSRRVSKEMYILFVINGINIKMRQVNYVVNETSPTLR